MVSKVTVYFELLIKSQQLLGGEFTGEHRTENPGVARRETDGICRLVGRSSNPVS